MYILCPLYLVRGTKEEIQKEVEKTLLGQVVITCYNNRTYMIDNIAWDLAETNTFNGEKEESISYMQYYTDKYNLA